MLCSPYNIVYYKHDTVNCLRSSNFCRCASHSLFYLFIYSFLWFILWHKHVQWHITYRNGVQFGDVCLKSFAHFVQIKFVFAIYSLFTCKAIWWKHCFLYVNVYTTCAYNSMTNISLNLVSHFQFQIHLLAVNGFDFDTMLIDFFFVDDFCRIWANQCKWHTRCHDYIANAVESIQIATVAHFFYLCVYSHVTDVKC